MSRTYRRKRGQSDAKYFTGDWQYFEYSWCWAAWVPYDPESIEYKKGIAKYRSDAGTTRCKEPGPSWFRRLYTQRPYRQDARRELHKFLQDEEYEPMILSKPKLDYWT